MKKNDNDIIRAYGIAADAYRKTGVDTAKAMARLKKIQLSVHCWQGDDVAGFENPDSVLTGGGLQVTGNYPGRARNVNELRSDIEKVYSMLPGRHRLNLHAIYGEFGGKNIDRDSIKPEHFNGWITWARKNGVKLDFNATCFSHPKAAGGFTLSSKDAGTRKFWIKHVQSCRRISAAMGKELGSPCMHNLWIPDGSKDIPADRWTHRKLLKDSLDEIFRTKYDPGHMKDSLEGKLFGIGSESFVVGSHEFYLGYAVKNGRIPCLDMGHFHPTESVADKISAVLQFSGEILLHISRGVRWDSDHVVVFNDEVTAVMEEVVRSNTLDRVYFALDFFDAGMNRVGAWTIGARSVLKSLLFALLQPNDELRRIEEKGDNFARLAMMERFKTMPFGAVWDYYCVQSGAPSEKDVIREVHEYEKDVLFTSRGITP